MSNQKVGHKIAIIGTVGVPANYGGFETLTENLVKYHDALSIQSLLTIYCSSKSYTTKELLLRLLMMFNMKR